jgi:hypothetical protein
VWEHSTVIVIIEGMCDAGYRVAAAMPKVQGTVA